MCTTFDANYGNISLFIGKNKKDKEIHQKF